MNCPKCNSTEIVKNGRTHYAKQRFRCQECRRQFGENPSQQPIEAATRSLIDKLLLERLSLEGNRAEDLPHFVGLQQVEVAG